MSSDSFESRASERSPFEKAQTTMHARTLISLALSAISIDYSVMLRVSNACGSCCSLENSRVRGLLQPHMS